MADELKIVAVFDVTGIVTGVTQAEEAIASLVGPLQTTSEKAEVVASAASNMATQLANAAKGAEELEVSLGKVSAQASSAGGASYGQIGASAVVAATGVEELGVQTGVLGTAISEVNTELEAEYALLTEQASAYSGLAAAKEELIASDNNLAAQEAALLAEMAAESELVEQQGSIYSAKVAAQEALTASTERAAVVEAQQEAILLDINTQLAAFAITTDEAATATQKFTVVKDESIIATQAMISAEAALNVILEKSEVSAKVVEAAIARLGAAAERAGFQVITTANSMQILAKAEEEVAIASSAMEKAEAFAGARMVATDVGASQLSYTFGFLAKTIPALTSVMSVLFAPVLVLTFIELISGMVDKFHEMEQAIRKGVLALDDLSTAGINQANSLDAVNLKLQDSINKLVGVPAQNGLKEAIIQIREETDKLNKSFADAIEKSLDLLKSSEIGLFRAALTGKAETSPLVNQYRKDAEQLETAISEQRGANAELNSLNESATEKQKADANARKTLADIKVNSLRQSTIENIEAIKKQAEVERDTEVESIRKGPISLSGQSKSEEIQNAKDRYSNIIASAKDLTSMLQEQGEAEKKLGEFSKLTTQNKKDEIAEAARSKAYTLDSAKLKVIEDEAKEESTIRNKAIEDTVKKRETDLNDEVALLVFHGESKVQAEIQTNSKLKNILQQEKSDKLVALDAQYADEFANIEKKRALHASESHPGTEREKFAIEDAALIVEATTRYKAAQESIITEGNAKIKAAGDKGLEEQRALLKEEEVFLVKSDAMVEAYAKKQLIGLDKGSEKSGHLEEDVEGALKLKAIEDITKAQEHLYSAGIISRSEERDNIEETIKSLKEQQRIAEEVIQKRIDANKNEMTPKGGVRTLDDVNRQKEIDDDTKKLVQTTESYTAAITSAQASWEKLDLTTDSYFTRLNNQSNNVKDSFQIGWQGAINNLNSGMSSAFDQWIAHGGRFGVMMNNVAVKMLTDFTNVFTTLAEKQIESHVAGVFGVDINKGAEGLGGGAQAGQTAALTTSTTSLGAFTAAVNTATVAQGGHAPVVTASTVAHGAHAPTVWATTQAHMAHFAAVIHSTLAHIGHGIAVFFTSIAHGIHAAAVWLSTGAHLQHTIALIGDTIALIIHKIVTLFTSGGAATGGLISGGGTGTSDSIPLMVSSGEYVVKESVVSKPGMTNFLHKLNSDTLSSPKATDGQYPHFAEGGLVGSTQQHFGGDAVQPHAAFSNVTGAGKPGTVGNTSSAVDSHDSHNFRFQYAPQFGKDFDIDEHGPTIAGYMRNTLKRAGYDI